MGEKIKTTRGSTALKCNWYGQMVVPNISRGGPGTPVTLHVEDLPRPHQLFFFKFVQVDCWGGSKSSLRDVISWYSLIAKSLPVDCKISQGTLHWGRLLLLAATPCSIFDGCCTHEKLQLSSYNQLHRCTQMWPFAQGICMVTGAAVITFAFVLSHFFASRSGIYVHCTWDQTPRSREA